MSAVAVFQNVGKFYRTGTFGPHTGVQAVKGINLTIQRGEVFGLLGPNRAGKTTLVKLLLSLCRPTEGTITRFDRPVRDTATLARVGYMHENQHFPRYLTASELLHYYGGLSLVKLEALKPRVEALLQQVGLADRKDEPISRFSKGMVQRLGLAQSLINEPDLLILDEPTEGLDLLGRQLLRNIIGHQKARGATVILISHVLTEVEQTCDRIGVVVGGKVVRVAPLADLLKDPKSGQPITLERVLQPLYEGRSMNLPTALLTIKWMIRDTFRQSLASRLFWVLAGVSFICILFCFSVSVTGEDKLPTGPSDLPVGLPKKDREIDKLGPEGVKKEGVDVLGSKLHLGFGLFQVDAGRDRADAVRFLQIWMAGVVADTAGVFLVLIWTAGFLPTFLEPSHATVLLAKPVPRWSLVVGKYLGVLAFVFVQATFFVLGTWLALGLCTGVYDPLYLLSIPLLVIHFGVFYSFSVLLAVWTRSTVVCVFGSLLFWVICWGLNFGRNAVEVHSIEGMTPTGRTVLEVSYWMLPKPADMNSILFDALKATGFSGGVLEMEKLKAAGKFHPELSVLASMLFAVVMIAIAARELHTTDY